MQLTLSYLDQILVLLVFAASLNLVMGYAGIFSAAHAAFGAVGGYTFMYLITKSHWSYVPAALVGIGIALVFGGLIGVAALRLDVLWLVLLTLGAQLVIVGVVAGLQQLGGSYGMTADNLKIFGHPLVEPGQLLPFLAIISAVIFLVCWRIGESPYGRVLRGIREDETAARSLGRNIFAYKLAIFAITAAMAGLGGVLLSTQTGLASPQLFGFNVSVQMIAMVIIGGMGNLIGTIVGVVLIVVSTPFFENVIHLKSNVASLAQLTAYGVALVIVVFFRPEGLIPEGTSARRIAKAIATGQFLRALASFRRPGERVEQLPGSDAGLIPVGGTGELSVADAAATNGHEGDGAAAVLRAPRAHALHHLPRDATADVGRGDVVLEVRDISKAFGGIRAVNGLSMTLKKGQITALVGPNGAGKTTVFNLITGALPIDAGQVVLKGEDITGMRPDQVTKLGMVRSFQDVRVFPKLSVLDNVMLGVQHQPGAHLIPLFTRPLLVRKTDEEAREAAMGWLRFIEMDDLAHVRTASLGFGQQKLVALARILATDAEVLLLDEPASGIDYQWLDEMLNVVQELRAVGRTVCIVEHNLEVVGRLADHVYFMELGRVTAEGGFEELTSDPRLAEAYFGAV